MVKKQKKIDMKCFCKVNSFFQKKIS